MNEALTASAEEEPKSPLAAFIDEEAEKIQLVSWGMTNSRFRLDLPLKIVEKYPVLEPYELIVSGWRNRGGGTKLNKLFGELVILMRASEETRDAWARFIVHLFEKFDIEKEKLVLMMSEGVASGLAEAGISAVNKRSEAAKAKKRSRNRTVGTIGVAVAGAAIAVASQPEREDLRELGVPEGIEDILSAHDRYTALIEEATVEAGALSTDAAASIAARSISIGDAIAQTVPEGPGVVESEPRREREPERTRRSQPEPEPAEIAATEPTPEPEPEPRILPIDEAVAEIEAQEQVEVEAPNPWLRVNEVSSEDLEGATIAIRPGTVPVYNEDGTFMNNIEGDRRGTWRDVQKMTVEIDGERVLCLSSPASNGQGIALIPARYLRVRVNAVGSTDQPHEGQ